MFILALRDAFFPKTLSNSIRTPTTYNTYCFTTAKNGYANAPQCCITLTLSDVSFSR